MKPEVTRLRVRLSVEQRDALAEEASRRDVPVSVVIASAIQTVTGVPDTLKRCGVHRSFWDKEEAAR